MKKLLVLFALVLSLGCGAALPAIIAGITTAADLIQLFDDKISPENQAAQQQCADMIAGLPSGATNLTQVITACDELNDAFLSLQDEISRLRNTKSPAREQVAEAKMHAADWYESKTKVDEAVK